MQAVAAACHVWMVCGCQHGGLSSAAAGAEQRHLHCPALVASDQLPVLLAGDLPAPGLQGQAHAESDCLLAVGQRLASCAELVCDWKCVHALAAAAANGHA